MRYVGQHHEVGVEFPLAALSDGAEGLARIERAFEERHEELYGFSAPGRPLRGHRPARDGPRRHGRRPTCTQPPQEAGDTLKGHRAAWLPTRAQAPRRSRSTTATAWRRGRRSPGRRSWSAATTTVLVPEGFRLDVDALGSLILRNDSAQGAAR